MTSDERMLRSCLRSNVEEKLPSVEIGEIMATSFAINNTRTNQSTWYGTSEEWKMNVKLQNVCCRRDAREYETGKPKRTTKT